MGEFILVNGQTGVGLLCLSVAFFHILGAILSFLPIPLAVSKKHDDFRTFRWRNLIISWCHALIVALWSSYCLLFYFGQMWKDMVLYCNGPLYALSCFTTGYFIYDLLDIYRNGWVREKWDIYIHHTAIIASAAYVIINMECVSYQILGMVAEVNTTFLHARQLFHLAEVPKSHWLAKLNTNLNLVTFAVFRFPPMAVLLWGVTFDGFRVPLWYVSYYSFCLVTLTGMNVILLYRLIVSDVLTNEKEPVVEESKTPNGKIVKCGEGDEDHPVKNGFVKCASDVSDSDSTTKSPKSNSIRFRNNVIKDVNHLNDGIQRKLNVRV